MSDEAQALRRGVSDGLFACRCPRPQGQGTYTEDYHRQECQWNNAIKRIYELERAEDAKR